jgi:hypothetical protein
VKLPHRQVHPDDDEAQLAVELGVDRVYYAADPLWYVRLTSRFRLNWHRELATLVTVFAAGIALGLLLGHL